MILKFFVAYPYVVYSILTWGLIIIFLGFKAIKRLYPAALLGAIFIFGTTYWLIAVGVYKFNITFLPVFGIPFPFILWGAANGIIFAYYFGVKIYQRFLSILIFAGVTYVRICLTRPRAFHNRDTLLVYSAFFNLFSNKLTRTKPKAASTRTS